MNNLSEKFIDACLTQEEAQYILEALHRHVGSNKLYLSVTPTMEDAKKVKILEDILLGIQIIDQIEYYLKTPYDVDFNDDSDNKTMDTSSV
jgi:hypothetical protein